MNEYDSDEAFDPFFASSHTLDMPNVRRMLQGMGIMVDLEPGIEQLPQERLQAAVDLGALRIVTGGSLLELKQVSPDGIQTTEIDYGTQEADAGHIRFPDGRQWQLYGLEVVNPDGTSEEPSVPGIKELRARLSDAIENSDWAVVHERNPLQRDRRTQDLE